MATIHYRGLLLACISFVWSLAACAENFTTNIVNGTSVDLNDDYIVGDSGSFNFFRVQNGGSQTNIDGIVGYRSTARSNSVVITDANSLWQNDGDLVVGFTGTVNQVTITNSGRVNCVNGTIGSDVGAVSNRVLVSGPGSRLFNGSTLTVGQDGSFNQLIITNGARVDNSFSFIGMNTTAISNSALVTGSGAVWSNVNILYVGYSGNGSKLTIEDGARVVDSSTSVIGRFSTNNVVVVRGTNTVWSNGQTLTVGVSGGTNSLTIQNGAIVSNPAANVGSFNGGGGNRILVSDTNSLWNSSGTFFFGRAAGGNLLTISNAAAVRAVGMIVGEGSGSPSNRIDITGASLFVSNAAGNASFDIRRGTVTLNSGALNVNQLYLTNGASAAFTFKGGNMITKATTVSNGATFVVGDATNTATLNLVAGTHSFANGLSVSSNASLTGTGTIVGSVTNNGTISPGNSAGSLTITGTLTQQTAATLVIELGGYAQGTSYDFISVSGNAAFNGRLAASPINGFENTVTNGASFTVLTAAGGISGAFNNIASGSRLVITNGFGDVLVTYAGTSLVLSDYRDIRDSDSDGMPNWWEQKYFGSTTAAVAGADDDGDGLSNLQEYQVGTSPTDATSALRITAIAREANNIRVTWMTAVGKTNTLQFTAGAAGGSYSNNFTDLFSVTNTTGTVTNFLHVGAATNSPARYYRVRQSP